MRTMNAISIPVELLFKFSSCAITNSEIIKNILRDQTENMTLFLYMITAARLLYAYRWKDNKRMDCKAYRSG